MGLIACKFGGSSAADGLQIRKIRDIAAANPDRRYIVVSAPGKRYDADNKITDLLYLLKAQTEHNAPYGQLLQVIKERFLGLEADLGIHVGIADEFITIEENLKNGATADYLASRGEYLSAKIIAAFIGYDFVDAAGLVLFSAKGKFLYEETNDALGAELAKHERAVLPGFYGTLPDGSIKTFTRGGSDITGALASRAAKADVYENWTDVSGFLMADPRIVENAKAISYISYKELRELSYMGASVLHENAIYPARLAGIPINIRNTNIPDDPGTIISADDKPQEGQIITGVAGNKDFTVIGIYKNMMSNEIGFIKRILSILEDYDIPIEHIPSGIDTVSLVIADKYLDEKLGDLIEDFEKKLGADSIELYENMSLIATVGLGMASVPGVAAKLFGSLTEAGVNIRMIDQGSSELNIIVGVETKDFDTAIRAIYSAFVA
ncbi:MAG: aspartate kinase [Clostridiales Family XIII bacterium]|jgi:aspartate kinase|nr:aspartate kinase [Clostridiales Family XIII bacterium]